MRRVINEFKNNYVTASDQAQKEVYADGYIFLATTALNSRVNLNEIIYHQHLGPQRLQRNCSRHQLHLNFLPDSLPLICPGIQGCHPLRPTDCYPPFDPETIALATFLLTKKE